MQGAAPPRQREGEPFRNLGMGCGMGFNLALLGDSKAPNTPFGCSAPAMAGLLEKHAREDPRYVS